MFEAGKELDGYRLIRKIGEGGFGEVWLCFSAALETYLALKVVLGSRRELAAVKQFKRVALASRCGSLMPIDHVGVIGNALYYVMPLADGMAEGSPENADWEPMTLKARIQVQKNDFRWFDAATISGWMTDIADATAAISDQGLIHRDIKPDNILFVSGRPVLSDISLLREDATTITEIGTPGYLPPSYYVESGGQPDMWALAATLYTLLTGNPPDKIGRPAFRWPPQGEKSLSSEERTEWLRLHGVVFRATDEKASERFRDFKALGDALQPGSRQPRRSEPRGPAINLWARGLDALSASVGGIARLLDFRRPAEPADLKFPEIAVAAKRMTKSEKTDYATLAYLGGIYFSKENYQGALECLNTLRSKYPISKFNPSFATLRARALFQLGRRDDALEALRSSMRKHIPPDIPSLIHRLNLWEEFGDLESAETELSRVIALKSPPPITMHFTMRANIRLKRGKFSGVEEDVRAAATLDDDPARAGMAGRLRRQYIEESPDYAKYLDSIGVEVGSS